MKRSQPAAAPTERSKETWALQFEPAAVLLPNAEPIARGTRWQPSYSRERGAHFQRFTRFSQPLRTLAPFLALAMSNSPMLGALPSLMKYIDG
jgi:hypothetical protein